MDQIVMYDNLRIFWGLEDFRLIIAWKDKKIEQLDQRQIIVKIPMFWFNLFMLVDGMNSDFKNFFDLNIGVVWVWYECGDCIDSKMSHLEHLVTKISKKFFFRSKPHPLRVDKSRSR